jgi:hypothetical protein
MRRAHTTINVNRLSKKFALIETVVGKNPFGMVLAIDLRQLVET